MEMYKGVLCMRKRTFFLFGIAVIGAAIFAQTVYAQPRINEREG
jgi:hypothetical protein